MASEIDPEFRDLMTSIARALELTFNDPGEKKVAFALLICPFDTVGLCNYLSNTDRADMVKMLRETADRIERDPAAWPS